MPSPRRLSWSHGLILAVLAVWGAAAASGEGGAGGAADPASGAGGERRHALSLVGEPKMPADFRHFGWVNPDAPKGGTVRLAAIGAFDSLNAFSTKGSPALGLGLIHDSLMAASLDEPSTEYGLIAEWVSYPPDYSSVTFGLRPEARFHDGQPVTPEDVIFSLEALKKANPFYSFYFKNVVKAEKTGPHEVTFTFDRCGNRELPHIVGQLSILPKHFWEGTDAQGKPRDITTNTLEIPAGSGAYRIKAVEPGRTIVYERVKDYWAKDLPVMRGQWNFDGISYVYFRDRVPAFEAFKARTVDYWEETSATAWATQYGFDAVTKGLVRKEAIPISRLAPMQAFAFNLRRRQFQDRRVRQAFNLAFNFERANSSLFYGQYIRAKSYFGNSELEAAGLPSGKELEILETLRKDVPPEVFTAEWKNPVNADAQAFRAHMLEARRLLEEAGWTLGPPPDAECGFWCRLGLGSPGGGKLLLHNAAGETLDAEFLVTSPDFQRIVLPYIEDLRALGINASIRVVDSTQYERRVTTFDFDLITTTFAQSDSPGNEQRDFWGSAAADREGSRNVIGIKNPAVDALIEKIVFSDCRATLDAASLRKDLVAATRALDRVLLWNFYVVPQWHYPFERIASWDIFGRPAHLPSQTAGFPQIWWMKEAGKQAGKQAPAGAQP